MTTKIFLILIKCLTAIGLGILEGNGAVYFFNRIPAQWLCDYGETPTPEMTDPYTQRIKSLPWKYTFTMAFVVLNTKLVIDDWQFAIGASLAIWLLLELAIGDIKYKIIPDQLVILLAATGLSFIPYHGSWKTGLIGAAIGFGIIGVIALVGKMAYRREAIGGGDVKVFTALGFIAGPSGILFIFVVSTLLSAMHFTWLLLTKRAKPRDSRAMVPYIAIAATAYLVFFWHKFAFHNF